MELVKDKEQWFDINKLRRLPANFSVICESCGVDLECNEDLFIIKGYEDENVVIFYYLENIICPSCGKKLVYNRAYKPGALDVTAELGVIRKEEE